MSDDLTGKTFGRWTVLDLVVISVPAAQTKRPKLLLQKRRYWRCQCSCGTIKNVYERSLVTGVSVSCGCYRAEFLRTCNVTHGRTRTPEYNIWSKIISRCELPTDRDYSRYGGRGITMCDRWRSSFTNFFADMGPRPSQSHSIDRIDNNGPYAPDNCRWATKQDQARNTRHNHILELDGRSMSIMEWSEVTGIPHRIIQERIDRLGWSVQNALTIPTKRAVFRVKNQ